MIWIYTVVAIFMLAADQLAKGNGPLYHAAR